MRSVRLVNFNRLVVDEIGRFKRSQPLELLFQLFSQCFLLGKIFFAEKRDVRIKHRGINVFTLEFVAIVLDIVFQRDNIGQIVEITTDCARKERFNAVHVGRNSFSARSRHGKRVAAVTRIIKY